MLVATALCADRGAAALSANAAPRAHAEPARTSLSFTARIIRGLSRTLGQVGDVVLARQEVRAGRAVPRGPVLLAAQSPGAPHLPISPFQFRLPPPVV